MISLSINKSNKWKFLIISISLILFSLIIVTHKNDIPILDEAEFYKASLPKNGFQIYRYYGGEFGGGGVSRVNMDPTWHPAGYIILLRWWQVLINFGFSNARILGVALQILSAILFSLFLFKNKYLNSNTLIVFLSLLFSIPLISEGALLLDIDGTILLLLLPLFLLYCNKVLSTLNTYRLEDYILFSIFISVILLFKIIPIVLVFFIIFLFLILTKSKISHFKSWAYFFLIGTGIFIINWKIITTVTDFQFKGPFQDNIGRSSNLLEEMPLNKMHLFLTRDIIKISAWVGIPLIIKSILDFIISLKNLYFKLVRDISINDKFIFLRFTTFAYIAAYIILGKSIIYSFPKYLLPMLPIILFLLVYDSTIYINRLIKSNRQNHFFIIVVILSALFIIAGDQVKLILNFFDNNKHLINNKLQAFLVINFLILLILLIWYLFENRKPENFTNKGFGAFLILLYTYSFGISASFQTITQKGSINYDYGKAGALEAIKYLNNNKSNGTIIGPLEILYNLKVEDQKYIFDGALFTKEILNNNIDATFILTKDTKLIFIENYPQIFKRGKEVFKSNSYEIITTKK